MSEIIDLMLKSKDLAWAARAADFIAASSDEDLIVHTIDLKSRQTGWINCALRPGAKHSKLGLPFDMEELA